MKEEEGSIIADIDLDEMNDYRTNLPFTDY